MMDITDINRIRYRLEALGDGQARLVIEVRSRRGSAQVQLTPAETAEVWATRGEMPTQLAELVPEALWDAHRERLLDVLSR